MAQIELRQIRKAQREDNLIETWRRAVIDNRLPNVDECHSKEDLAMRRQFHKLKMIRGILYRECTEESKTTRQLVLPRIYKNERVAYTTILDILAENEPYLY